MGGETCQAFQDRVSSDPFSAALARSELDTGSWLPVDLGPPPTAYGPFWNPAPCPPAPVNLAEHPIRRKQVLSGLTHEYYIAA